MKNKYDYLIVGCGLFGSTFANRLRDNNKKVLLIDKRPQIAGNVYTENINGVNVHKFGCHIFHTNKKDVWDYVNQFAKFNNYKHKGVVNYKGKIYSFPINLMTMCQMWGISTPQEAKKIIEEDKVHFENPQNMEEWCLTNIGKQLYETFIKEYSRKQWNEDPKKLSASIIKRLPVRFTFDDDYFHDSTYQGIPIGGYTNLVSNMISGIPVELGMDFATIKDKWKDYADNLVYCGGIDSYFNYCYGELEYRSLTWENKELKTDFQGCSVVNYTDEASKFTRIIEHKHFENPNMLNTVISYEYPADWKETKDPYYPINNEKNSSLYQKYRLLAKKEKNVIISGRLGSYKYIDMDDTISLALSLSEKERN